MTTNSEAARPHATVIPFPRKKPLELHEIPREWSDALKGTYVHMTYDGGWPHGEAFAHCQVTHDERQRPGESYDEFLQRAARSAFARLPRR